MKRVLFVCAENAGRSQIAERLSNREAEQRGLHWRAESAGTLPAEQIHGPVHDLLRAEGFSVHDARPKQFEVAGAGKYERIISFGCLVKGAMPEAIRGRIVDWTVDDPKDADQEALRSIASVIAQHVDALIDALSQETS